MALIYISAATLSTTHIIPVHHMSVGTEGIDPTCGHAMHKQLQAANATCSSVHIPGVKHQSVHLQCGVQHLHRQPYHKMQQHQLLQHLIYQSAGGPGLPATNHSHPMGLQLRLQAPLLHARDGVCTSSSQTGCNTFTLPSPQSAEGRLRPQRAANPSPGDVPRT